MKYKKHIGAGVLAFSLLMVGTSVFALSTQDANISPSSINDPQNHKFGNKNKKGNHLIGTVISVNGNNFTVGVKNHKTQIVTSYDILTSPSSTIMIDGKLAQISDITVGQKVIVKGQIDQVAKTVVATKVKIVTNLIKQNVNKHKHHKA